MRIFVTGRNGFIAQNLIVQLKKDGHDIAFSSKDDDITKKLVEFNPQIICHLAAELYHDSKMVDSNILLTHNILEYCRIYGIKKLIIFGSSSEYGRKKNAMSETDVLEPETIYEGTKACATLLSRSYAFTYHIKTTVIRPFTVYGPNEKPNKLLQIVFNNKLKSLNNACHDWIFIDDFIDATLKIIYFNEENIFELVNIGSGVQYSNEEIVKKCQKIVNFPIEYEISNIGKKYDTMNWVCDTTLLHTKYKFTPKYSIEDGLRLYYSRITS